ncbi:MAG: polysaccharide biosynthesis/export family protein [Acidobacteria bacterium]|nr:polysaccharide biosynthesis/export family protein [Acidobacteriota bacterium]
MSLPDRTATRALSVNAWKRALTCRFTGLLALGMITLLASACTAPGMKLNMKPGSGESTTAVDGLAITLRPLNPETLRNQVIRRTQASDLAPLLAVKPTAYQIGPQDVILVTVWDHPEITLPLGQYRQDNAAGMIVDEGGAIFFPYVGRLEVKGLTVSQVRDLLTTRLSKVLQNPQIDVKVTAFRSQKVYVGGEVKAPAVYNVTDVPFTLAEAVNRAGGFLPGADDSRLLLTRGDRTWRINFHELMTSGNQISQILLQDGDALQVPNSQDDPVYMMGEMLKPGLLPLVHGNLSLAQALTSSGGVLGGSADARSIYVIRKGASANAVNVFHLDGRNPASMVMADQFWLNPRDIVYVDAGTLVRFSRVMNMLLPTVTAVTGTSLTAAQIKYYLPNRDK